MTKQNQESETQTLSSGKRQAFSLHVFDVLFAEMRRCNEIQARIERCYR